MSSVETPTTTTLTTNNNDKNNNNNVCDDATGIQTRKRLRFAPTELQPKMTDKDAIKDFVSCSFESLPATIKSTATKFCDKFHSLGTLARNKHSTLQKYDNADYIPRSAKSNFTLKSNKRVMETATFKTQATTIEQLVAAFQQQLKAATKVVTQEELNVLKQDIQAHFFNGLYDISMLVLINENQTRPDQPARALSLRIIETHGSTLLKHTGLTTSDIYQRYKEHFNEAEAHKPGSLPEELTLAVAPFIDATHEILDVIFVKSWELAVANLIAQEKKAAMDLYMKSRTAETSNEETAMIVDAEQSINSDTIKDLIKAGVQEETRNLRTQVNTLQNKLSSQSKNTRGASTGRAPSTKKNPVKEQKSRSNNKKNDKKDAERGRSKNRTENNKKGKSKRRSRSRGRDSADDNSSASSDASNASKKKSKRKQKGQRKGKHKNDSKNTRRN